MEFVDYKCLESLLIEGEELIVTEGFKDTAFKIIKGIFKILFLLYNCDIRNR